MRELILGHRAQDYREQFIRENPAAADEGHLRALDWIERFIIEPAYRLYQRFPPASRPA